MLLWIAAIALLIGAPLLVLPMILACAGVALPPPVITAITGIGAFILIVGVLAFALWYLLCRKTTSCPTMQAVQCFLWVIMLLCALAFVITAVLSKLGCAVPWLAPGFIWGMAYALLNSAMSKAGCPDKCP